MQHLTATGSTRPVHAAFPHLQHRQARRGVGNSLTGTPALGAAPSDGGGGDKCCGAGEYMGVRGGNVCAQGKVFGFERVRDSLSAGESPVLSLGALCKPA